MSIMLQEKRATRGLRMSALVGEAMEEDNSFYSGEIWQEADSDDDSFHSDDEEVKPDQFDSDFNDTEDEESSDSEDENNIRKTERTQVGNVFNIDRMITYTNTAFPILEH